MWRESSLLCDRVVRIMNSKTYVFSDSVLCLGGISPQPVQPGMTTLDGIWKLAISKNWIELMEKRWKSNWKNSRMHYSGHSQWDSKDVGRIRVWIWAISRKDHLHVHVRWTLYGEKGNENCWKVNSLNVATYANKFPLGSWSFWGLGREKRWYETHVQKSNGEWNWVAEIMTINFAESGHSHISDHQPFGKRRIEK